VRHDPVGLPEGCSDTGHAHLFIAVIRRALATRCGLLQCPRHHGHHGFHHWSQFQDVPSWSQPQVWQRHSVWHYLFGRNCLRFLVKLKSCTGGSCSIAYVIPHSCDCHANQSRSNIPCKQGLCQGRQGKRKNPKSVFKPASIHPHTNPGTH
jgi:hypothetical protein